MSGDDGYVQPIRAKVVAQQMKKQKKLLAGHHISTHQQIQALYELFKEEIPISVIIALGECKINQIYDKMMDLDKYMDLDDGITPYIEDSNRHNHNNKSLENVLSIPGMFLHL